MIDAGIMNIRPVNDIVIGLHTHPFTTAGDICLRKGPMEAGSDVIKITVKGKKGHAEYCVLVAEPTVFGTDNLKMVHELVKLFQKPYGVVLNKCLKNEWNPAKEYCVQEGIPILCELPFDQKLAEIQSNGGLVVRKAKQYKNCFSELLKSIEKEVRHELFYTDDRINGAELFISCDRPMCCHCFDTRTYTKKYG